MIKFFKKWFLEDNKELCLYADSSWKDGKASFSYTDTHNEIFYVSKLFPCDSSFVAECYAVYNAICHGITSAKKNNYTNITIYTDLLKLEDLNTGLKNKKLKKKRNCVASSLLDHMESYIIVHHPEIKIKIVYMDHKKEPHLRLVDLLAYRQLQGIVLDKYKKDVFKDLSHWSVQQFTFETF